MDAVGSQSLLVLAGTGIGSDDHDHPWLFSIPGRTGDRVGTDDLPAVALIRRQEHISVVGRDDGDLPFLERGDGAGNHGLVRSVDRMLL